MNNLTIIIPVHEFNETISGYLDKAIESIKRQEGDVEKPDLIIVSAYNIVNDVNKFLAEKYNSEFISIANKNKTNYQSQVNFGVEFVKTKYFSVLEFDDEYGTSFIKNINVYTETYPNIDIFLTMMIEVNEKNEGIKLTNETVWAQQFVGENGEMGYLNSTSLKQFTDFKLSGAVIKTSEFKNIGGYKSNIELTFMYEFLLRALENTLKVFTIPKIMYKHFATREGSMFSTYLKTMPIDERKFWFDTANKEFNFANDRVINKPGYQKQIISE